MGKITFILLHFTGQAPTYPGVQLVLGGTLFLRIEVGGYVVVKALVSLGDKQYVSADNVTGCLFWWEQRVSLLHGSQ